MYYDLNARVGICVAFESTTNGTMPEGFWAVIVIIVAIVAYVLAKVVYYVRRSDEQWTEVDKSKLKEWKDDEDW